VSQALERVSRLLPSERNWITLALDQPGERHHANQTFMVIVAGSRGFCIGWGQRRACRTADDRGE
jgi:hypothetical protein